MNEIIYYVIIADIKKHKCLLSYSRKSALLQLLSRNFFEKTHKFMVEINLEWQGPLDFSDSSKLGWKNYIYFHSILTVPERIYYIGHSTSKQTNRQESHYSNLLMKGNSTFDITQMHGEDYYDFVSNDNLILNTYKGILIEGDINCLNWELSTKERANDIRQEVVNKTKIYYAEIVESNNEFNVEILGLLKAIEANLQYYLVKKYQLDVFKNGFYKIGLNSYNNGFITKSIIINNDLSCIEAENQQVFEIHFGDSINLSNETDKQIDKIKNKKLDQKWKDLF